MMERTIPSSSMLEAQGGMDAEAKIKTEARGWDQQSQLRMPTRGQVPQMLPSWLRDTSDLKPRRRMRRRRSAMQRYALFARAISSMRALRLATIGLAISVACE